MYDIIGDIHGHASALEALLLKMNYKEVNGVWQHPGRKVIFVGDYIDRGPAIRETLHIVRSMTENDKAIALWFQDTKVGYIPKEKNEVLARLMDAGKQFYATISANEMEGNWLKLEIKVILKD